MKTIDVDVQKKVKENKIALNVEEFDKYEPGKKLFFIQALTPTKKMDPKFETPNIPNGTILNKDAGNLDLKVPQVGSCVELEIPKDVCRWFQVKFIPQKTRFLVAFDGGDITRPRIVGRDYIEEQGCYNSPTDHQSTWFGLRI